MPKWVPSTDELANSTSFSKLRAITARRTHPIDQAQELTTAVLLASLERDLSGRREDRIIGAPSHRRFFLGTLAPQKEQEADEGEEISSVEETKDFSTMGARFMLRKEDISSARIAVGLSFCVFYPVFPTWDEVIGTIRVEPPPAGEDDADEPETVPPGPTKIGSRDYNLPSVEKRLHIEDAWTISLADIERQRSKELRFPLSALRAQCRTATEDPDILRVRPGDERLFKRLESLTPEDMQGPDAAARFQQRVNGLRKTGEPAFPTYQGEVSVSIVEYDDELAEVSIVFVNTSSPGDFEPITKANFFDTRFRVTLEAARIQPTIMEQNERQDVHRVRKTGAKGVRCAVIEHDGTIENLPIPFSVIAATETEESFERLCKFESLMGIDALTALDAVETEMKRYSLMWLERIKADGDAHRRQHAEGLRTMFEAEIQRFRQGISALRADPRALTAFRMANQTISIAKGYANWRPFQLIFFVSTLKDVVARERPEVGDDRDKVDVLWFPTGGGKTETYLALILFTLVYDRLRGKHRGVSAWVKFPLRMLSLDQLDRFAEMVTVLNRLSAEHKPQAIPGDPFEIGYFMGDRNTPNQWAVARQHQRSGMAPQDIADRFDGIRSAHPDLSENAIAELSLDGLSEIDTRRYMLIDICPISNCGERTYIWPDSTARTMAIKCPTHGRLPIRFIDDELYRHPTSIIISTIDKLAIIAFNDGIRNLVVRPYFACRDHGYLATNVCRHCDQVRAKNPSIVSVEPSQFYDPAPAVQVQDELHLLKEQLGAYDSHYEALISFLHDDLLARPGYKIAGHRGKTKIVAATATIASYEDHIAHLYGRSARRFPGAGPTPGETIYSRQQIVKGLPVAQRIMASLWPTMTRLSGAVARVEAAYLTGLAALATDFAAYRDILRRYAPGTETLTDDQLRTILDQASTALTYYMNKPRAYTGSDNLRKEVEQGIESDSSHPLRELTALADFTTLTGDSEFRFIRETKSQLERGGFGQGRWLAHVAATSIISHGVDVPRLNAIIFSGMPADTAEYIQSSSRVGRRLLGLSLVIHDTNRPREEGHYINHIGYHENLDFHIRGVAINRGSRLLLGRTFPGLFAGLVRLYWNPTHPKSHGFDFSMRDARPLLKALQDNRVKTELRQILRTSLARSTAVTDTPFLEEEIERQWDAMEREGMKRFGESDSLISLFKEHRPLLNHREVETSFPLLMDAESHQFVDRRSTPIRMQSRTDEPPPGALEDGAEEAHPDDT